jgi:phosphonate transport system ATP-binding protein
VGLRDGRVVFEGTKEDLTMDVVNDIYYEDDEEVRVVDTDTDADADADPDEESAGIEQEV